MKFFLSIILYFGLQAALFAQVDFSVDSALLAKYSKNEFKIKRSQPLQYKHIVLLKLALGAYKEVLSEQISANCEFMPTCSSFSWLALNEFGVIKALFLTADRLTRCNGNSQPEYFPYLIRSEDAKILDFPYQYKFSK
jgi:uncharacterized protein